MRADKQPSEWESDLAEVGTGTPPSALDEWKANWTVVLAGGVGMMVIAFNLATLGVFIRPLEQEFGWSRLEITAGHSFTGIVAMFVGPFVGVLADRYGSRRVAIPGLVLFCLALASMSLATASILSWWLLWSGLAIATLVISPPVWTAAVTRSFSRSRGLALAIALSGTGLAQVAGPNIANALISAFGWRGAYLGIAAILAVIALPTALLFLPRVSKDQARDRTAARHPSIFGNGEWKVVLRSGRFVKLAFATLIFTICAVSFSVNLVPILVSNGATPTGAAAMAALIGAGSIVGRISTGFLLDRFNGNKVGAATVLAPIFGCLCFVLFPGSAGASAVGTFCVGLALGAELDVMAYLVSRHFGTERFATIFAMVCVGIGIGSSLGPALFSYVYDVAGTYAPAIWASIPLYSAGALALLTLGPYLEGERASPDENAVSTAEQPSEGALSPVTIKGTT